MMSQKKMLDKIKERIRIWNITFFVISIIIGLFIVLTSYLGWVNDILIETAIVISIGLMGLALGVSMGLQVAKNLVKEYKEDLE